MSLASPRLCERHCLINARERRIAKYSVSARSNGMLVSSGDVVDAALEALAAVVFAEGFELGEVVAAEAVGVDFEPGVRLGLFEFHQAGEGEIDFRFVEDVEQDHVVPVVPQPAQRRR